jgi:hypothetical protein
VVGSPPSITATILCPNLGLSDTLPGVFIKPENVKIPLTFERSFFYTNASQP